MPSLVIFFTLHIIQIAKTKIFNQPLYFSQNEYIPTQYPTIALPYDQNLSQHYQSLVQEYNITQQFSLPNLSQARVFSFLKSNNQDINLAILEDQRLSFIFNVKTYLFNKQLLIQPINYTFLLPYHNYLALYYLNNESYILLSKFQEEKILIQILNLNLHPSQQNFTIKNLTFVDYNPLCKVDSAFMFSLLVLFQQYCSNSTIQTYQIDLDQYEIANQTSFNLDQYNYSNQQIIQIHICSTKSFTILTLDYLLSINITSQKVIMQNILTQNNIWNFVMIGCNYTYLNRYFQTQTNESIIKTILLQKILILQSNDNVIVRYSKNCSIIIRKSFSQLFVLLNLPYLIGVTTTGELLAFRITIPKRTFTHINTSQIQLIQYGLNTKFYNDPNIVSTWDIQILSESQPKFLINQNAQFFTLIDTAKFMFFQSKIQESLPLQIKQIRANGKQINFQEDKQYLNCNFDRSGLKVLLIIGLQNNDHLVLIIKENTNKLLINLCANTKFSTIKQININQGFFKIIPSIDKPHFYIVQSYQLKIFVFENLKLLEKTLQFKLHIKDGNVVENQICILLIDCNEMCFEFIDQDIHLQKQFKLQQSECNNNDKALHRGLFFIDEHQIFFKNSEFQEQITINETIIKAEIIISQFQVLLFIKNEQHLQIKILSYFQNELQFLYNCPLYGFVLRFPLNYKLFNNFLMILADNPMYNSPVVLIFDLKNRSITSLIQVIQIDEDLLQFDFIYNSRGFFYVFQNSIQIKQLDFQLIIFEKEFETRDVTVNLEYQLFFKNPITNEIVNSNQTFEYFNNNYQLSLIDEDIQILLSNKSLNMSNIYSNIKSVDIIPTNYFKIQTPLVFTKDKTVCQFYSKECCIYQTQLKCQLKNETYSTEIKEVFQHIYFIECNEYLLQCTMMLLQKQQIIVSTFTFYQDQQPKVITTTLLTEVWFDQDFHYNLNFKVRNGDITIFFSETKGAIYIFQSFQRERKIQWNFLNLRNYLFQARKTTDQNYLFLFESEQTIFYIILPISQNYVSATQQFQDVNQTQLQTCFNTQDLLKKLYKSAQSFIMKYEILQIIEFNVVNEKFDIDLLILLEEQNGFILNLQIDPSQQVSCTFEIIKTIRYPQNSKLNRLLYVDRDLIIISVSQLEEQNIILYDMIQSKNLQLIHSIFTFPDDNYIKIEQYNKTHYQIIKLKDQDYELEIIKISQYKLECLNSQNKMAKLIFKNEVSELTINLQITNQENSLQNHSKFIIIIMSTLVLQIYIIFKNRNKRVLKK